MSDGLMRKIDIGGRLTSVSVEGEAGRPVVLLSHSLACHREMWRPQMAALLQRFRVVRYDVRGHGESDPPEGRFTLQDLAEDVRALIGALELGHVHFVGLSLGGMIGQQLAVDHPHLVRSVVLADTLSTYEPEAQPMWQRRIEAASTPAGMEPLVEPTIARWFTEPFRARAPETIDWVRSMIRATSAAGFIGCCEALMQLNLTARLAGVRIPSLVLVGRQDPTTPVAGARVIAEALPDARLAIIEDAAHISNVEQEEVFTSHLVGFLDDMVGEAGGENEKWRSACSCRRPR